MEKKFAIIKNGILGKKYSLSIACVDEKTSQRINKKYRKKDKPTNILSFSLRENMGEIILCPSVIKKEAKNFDRTFPNFIGFLVIHGMLHLKGYEHSSTMEKLEKKYDQKYFGGHRYRVVHDKSRGRRIHQGRKNS
jgi:probable rRNA maturation factor